MKKKETRGRKKELEPLRNKWVISILNNTSEDPLRIQKYRTDKPASDGWYFKENLKKIKFISKKHNKIITLSDTKAGIPKQVLMDLGVVEVNYAVSFDRKNKKNRKLEVIRLKRSREVLLKLWLSSIQCNQELKFMASDYFVGSPYKEVIKEYLMLGWKKYPFPDWVIDRLKTELKKSKNSNLRNMDLEYDLFVPFVYANPQLFKAYWEDRDSFEKARDILFSIFPSPQEALNFVMAKGYLQWIVDFELAYGITQEKEPISNLFKFRFYQFYDNIRKAGLHEMLDLLDPSYSKDVLNQYKQKLEEKAQKNPQNGSSST